MNEHSWIKGNAANHHQHEPHWPGAKIYQRGIATGLATFGRRRLPGAVGSGRLAGW